MKRYVGIALTIAIAILIYYLNRPRGQQLPPDWGKAGKPATSPRTNPASKEPLGPAAMDFPDETPAKVLHVVDGDTAYFRLADGRVVKGRLAGIDAPECKKRQVTFASDQRSAQCVSEPATHGTRARDALVEILQSDNLRLSCVRKSDGTCKAGRYKRLLLRPSVRVGGEQRDVNLMMIERGAATAFTKYPEGRRAKLCQAEQIAQSQRLGVFADDAISGTKWFAAHRRLCVALVEANNRVDRHPQTPPKAGDKANN